MILKKAVLRDAVPSILSERGYSVSQRSGKGLLPGARLVATLGPDEFAVAVKALSSRQLSFTRQSSRIWRTLSSVDQVVAVAPAENPRDGFEVFQFESSKLVDCFDQAWSEMKKSKRPISQGVPIFIPLDSVSIKNVGHEVVDLKKIASWSRNFTSQDIRSRSSSSDESFIERVKREFAELNNVEVSKVSVEFRILA